VRVARTRSFEETLVEEAPVPALEAGDALVRIEACGLCGSDASRWYVETKVPTVLGHEPGGVVVATGKGARVKEGDRVFVHHHVACGECHACRRGYETSCALFKKTRLDPGGFAELVRVPKDNVERDTLVLADDTSWEQATFIEPLACSVRCLGKMRVHDQDSVLVIGLGAMGLMNGRLARHAGAAKVIGSDLSAVRRARSLEPAWGFDAALDPRAPEFGDALRALTDGRGPDHVIVGPGSAPALQQAMSAVAPGGTVVLFSPFSPKLEVPLSLHRLYFGEVNLTASYSCAAKETRAALELIRAGVVAVDRLVSHRLGLDGVGRGIAETAAAGDHWIKAVVYPQGVPGA
jgi:L-iditol 2-dehydrogenase